MISAKRVVNILKRQYKIDKVDFAIVVGSGLQDAVPDLENLTIVPYSKLHMPKSRVKGHSGKFVFGQYNNLNVVLVSRIHYYENGDMRKVRLPYQILNLLGAKQVVLLTSSGGINKTFRIGDVMLIKDHINLSGINPLVAIDPLEFTAMNNAYDTNLFEKVCQIADEKDINIRQGTHIQFSGPCYETMAEIDFARNIGADTVSMSTAIDCILCNYYKMKVVAFASVVNVFEKKEQDLTHEEVLKNAQKACQKIKMILSELIIE